MRFPTLDELLELHEQILDATGGERGVMATGSLASALERAQWGPFFGAVDLADRAALPLRGICQDHPFADGNKRTAFEAADEFLGRNGLLLRAPPEAIVDFMLRVAQGHLEVDDMAAWLRSHARNHEEPEGGDSDP